MTSISNRMHGFAAAFVLLGLAMPASTWAAKHKKKESSDPAPQPQPQVQTPPPATTQPTTQQGIAGQLERGKVALAGGSLKEAVNAFKNALDFDKTSAIALHGLGVAQYESGDKAKGTASLEKALAAADNVNRAVVYNMAVAYFSDNPMRAAKVVRDYLGRSGTPLDEPLQNVLGAALAAAPSSAKSGTVYTQLRDFYFGYDQKLASARNDGKARWGTKWIAKADAERKWKQSREKTAAYEQAESNAAHAALASKKASGAVYDLNHSLALHSEAEQNSVTHDQKIARKNEREVDRKLEDAKRELDKTPMPEFPKILEFIPIDAMKPEQNPPQN